MVIDKSTFSQINECLTIPLLDHKMKDSISELEKEFELLQKLNNKFKICSLKNKNLTNKRACSIDTMDIYEYIDKINSIIFSKNEIINENNSYKLNTNNSTSKEAKNSIDKILSEINIFLNIVKEIGKKILN